MAVETVPGTSLAYHLLAFDAAGRERTGEAVSSSRAVAEELANEPVTDVFLMSHGWKGDVPAARDQYRRWIGAMAACDADLARMRQVRPGFRPLLIGLHWPSLPWGDENLDTTGASFGPAAREGLDEYADRLGDTPAVRAALTTIFEVVSSGDPVTQLPPELRAAYEALDRALSLGSGGVGAAPGADREPFDPDRAFDDYLADEPPSFAFSLPNLGALLAPLRQLSFWKMKDRARQFGEGGGNLLLASLQQAAGARPVRFHLMGHSFGCIVVSSILNGAGGSGGAIRPVDSLALVQGALSLWSYCDDIPMAMGKPGYFRRIVADRRVQGVIVTTQSEFDTAVGRIYPLAAGAARQVAFELGVLPKYGAIGTFGIQGPGPTTVARDMLPPDKAYGFEMGKIYNLASGQFICEGGGVSGAHSDIDKPAVAHAVWEAAIG